MSQKRVSGAKAAELESGCPGSESSASSKRTSHTRARDHQEADPRIRATLIELGLRLRQARVARDITLEEMARRMSVNADTLSRLERGAPGVSVQTLAMSLWHMNLLDQLDAVLASGSDAEGERLASLRMPSRARGTRIHRGAPWAVLDEL